MIELERHDDVFVLTMAAGENRWNTTFVRAIAEALDEVEASEGAAALVTRSADAKFFSNGLDLDWVMAPDDHPEGGDRVAFGHEFMSLMGRIMTLPVPTIAAVNGHCFGAGFMSALCHDVRIARSDRGFMCATELAPLGANRQNMGWQKEALYGENSALDGSHGPAHMLRNSADFH